MTSLSTLVSLKELSLSDCSGLTSAGVQSLLRSRGANLEALTLSDPVYMSVDHDDCSFCDDALLRCIGECCPNLRVFAVRIGAESNVTEASLITLVQGCPLLEKFWVYCEALTDAFLFQLSERCPRVSKLTLWHGNYTDAGVIAVTSQYTMLVALELIDIAHLTDQSLVSIAKHCRGLKTLALRSNDHYTDAGLCHLFASCTQLTDVLLDLSRMTDRSVLALAQGCLMLSCLVLQADLVLTEKAIAYLATLHELQSLDIINCAVPDAALESIARHCHKLRYLALIGSTLWTEQGFVALLTHAKRLAYLQVTDFELTPKAKAAVLTRRPSSRRLGVQLDSYTFWM